MVTDSQFPNCQGYGRNKINASKMIKEESASEANKKNVDYQEDQQLGLKEDHIPSQRTNTIISFSS